jgi:hypothetical protein
MTGTADTGALEAGGPPRGKLTEYDISQAARRVRYVRFAEYFLIFVELALALNDVLAGFVELFVGLSVGVFKLPPELLPQFVAIFVYRFFVHRAVIDFFTLQSILPDVTLIAFAIVAYLSSGKLKPKAWRHYFWIFPGAALAAMWMSEANSSKAQAILADQSTFLQGQEALSFALAGLSAEVLVYALVVGLIGVCWLQIVKLTQTRWRIVDLLSLAERIRREEAPARRHGQPINRRRATIFLVLGVMIFAVIGPPQLYSLIETPITLGGFLLLVKSREYFQISADSLLATDRRQPILFLRSFVDDPRMVVRATWDQLVKIVDFSVETRLANHFMDFGPFIAVGSPLDKVPVPGAARVKLSDDQWQQWVTERMRACRIIVMYAGVTRWVGWELSEVVAAK